MRRKFKLYRAYGLLIQSPFDFSSVGLSPVEEVVPQQPVLTITNSKQSACSQTYLDDETSVNKTFGYYFKNGVGLFEFKSGGEIKVYVESDTSSPDFARILLNYPIASIFFQRGIYSLHASAVKFEGKVFIFPGRTMSGKSSIAARFVKLGGKLITEDTAVIDFSHGRPMVRSSYPFIKLSRDANKRLSFSSELGISLPNDKNSRLGYCVGHKNFQKESVFIDFCIFLSFGDTDCLDQIDSFAASQKLLNSSLNVYPFTPERHKSLFFWTSAFVRSVKSFHFQQQKKFTSLDALLKLTRSF